MVKYILLLLKIKNYHYYLTNNSNTYIYVHKTSIYRNNLYTFRNTQQQKVDIDWFTVVHRIDRCQQH